MSWASFLLKPCCDSTCHELFVVVGNDFLFFLADRFDAGIRGGQRNFAESIQDLHDLFLVDHHAVGFFQDFLQHVEFVFGWPATMFHIDVLLDHSAFEWSGTVQRVGRNDVAKVIGLHFLKQVTNPAAFQLEHAFGFATLQQSEMWPGRPAETKRIDRFAGRLLDQVDGVAAKWSGSADPKSPFSADRQLRHRSSTIG